MAELTGKVISELQAATTIGDSDLLALSQSGESKKITPPVLLSGVNGKIATLVRPNLLDNWYFVGGNYGYGSFPVNQNGQSSYGTSRYSVDRWFNGSGGDGVVVNSGYLTLTSGSIIKQKIVKPFASATLTMSAVDVNNRLISGTAVFAGSTTPVIFATDNDLQLYMADDDAGNIVFFVAALATTGIKAVKVELGDTQTIAHQENGTWVLNEVPNYAEELLKCQRYFIKCDGFVPGTGVNATTFYADISLPVTMVKAPTVSTSGSGYFVQSSGHLISGVNAASSLFTNAVRITGTADGVVANQVGVVSGLTITLSAE